MRFAILFFLSFSSFVHAQDVIIGRDAAPLNGEVVSDTFMFFNKTKAALRAPALVNSANWSPDSIGFYSIALGPNTKAKGDVSVALGSGAESNGFSSIAMGYTARAFGAWSTAIGNNSWTTGQHSIALGQGARAWEKNATAIGQGAFAYGLESLALGNNTTANGRNSTSIGYFNESDGWYSFTIGNFTHAPSYQEVVLGNFNTISNSTSPYNWIPEDPLFVLGNGQSGGFGGDDIRSDAMVVLKNGDVRFPDGSFLVGRDSMPKNGESVIGEMLFYDKNKNAFRGGRLESSRNWEPDSLGLGSFAFGYNVKAISDYSLALGYETKATAFASTAIGAHTEASGLRSIAIGSATKAIGNNSMAMGNSTSARGFNSTAMGGSTNAIGDYSTAMGHFTRSKGGYSTAIGYWTDAVGDYSTAIGYWTEAESYSETVIGRYNKFNTPNSTSSWDAEDRLFVIGNGESLTNRSDAMVVLKNGNTTLNGEFKIHAASANPDANLYMQAGSLSEGKILAVQPSGNFLMGDIDNIGDNLYIRAGGAERITVLDNGRVGVGVVDPLSILHVKGDTYFESDGGHLDLWAKAADGTSTRWMSFSNTTKDIFLGGIDDTGADLILRSGGNDQMRILNNGNVGIGNNAPSEKLEVSGNILASGSITENSDLRFKSKLMPIHSALSKVNQLNGYYYFLKATSFPEKAFTNKRQIGVIAQEVEELFPEMVFTDTEGFKSVSYSRLTPVLIEAVKELTEKNAQQDNQIKQLNHSLAQLLEKFAKLEALLTASKAEKNAE